MKAFVVALVSLTIALGAIGCVVEDRRTAPPPGQYPGGPPPAAQGAPPPAPAATQPPAAAPAPPPQAGGKGGKRI